METKQEDAEICQVCIDEKGLREYPDLGLHETIMSTPYQIPILPAAHKARFNCIRVPTYLYTIIWSVFESFWILFKYALCISPTYEIMTDESFTETFMKRIPYSALVTHFVNKEQTTEEEKKEEQKDIIEKGAEFDSLIMEALRPHTYPEYKAKGLKVRWSYNRRTLQYTLKEMETKDGIIYKPEDGDAWHLAKLFALHNAHYMIKFARHPTLHFPREAFIVITQKYFPNANHVLRELLDPHFEFTLEINEKVLLDHGSVLNARKGACCMWDIQMVPRIWIQGLLKWGGALPLPVLGHSPWPALQPYYQVIYKFCLSISTFYLTILQMKDYEAQLNRLCQLSKQKGGSGLLRKAPKNVPPKVWNLFQWARSLKEVLDFPYDPDKLISDPSALALVLADCIFRVSIQHGAEHEGVYNLPSRMNPMAIRMDLNKNVKLPTSVWGSKNVVGLSDCIRQDNYNRVFVRFTNAILYYDTRLIHTYYAFETRGPKWKQTAQQFRDELVNVPKQPNSYPLNLDQIASSIQW